MWDSLLKFVPPSVAHEWSAELLQLAALLTQKQTPSPALKRSWRGIEFLTPFGPAGGVDKTGSQIKSWQSLGAGFVEIGTITMRPQKPNPGVVLDRNISLQALWNRMGFPNDGVVETGLTLEENLPFKTTPWFINIGKNRETPNQDASHEYIQLVHILKKYADVFVVNISSPNTKNLRELLKPESLKNFLQPISSSCKEANKPFLLKLSPDSTEYELRSVLDTAAACDCAGFILTNTSLSRPSPSWPKSSEGGLSGAPIKALSMNALNLARAHFAEQGKRYLWISVGGVISPQDAIERLALGADLVQTYSGLIFSGPLFFREAARLQLKVLNDSQRFKLNQASSST